MAEKDGGATSGGRIRDLRFTKTSENQSDPECSPDGNPAGGLTSGGPCCAHLRVVYEKLSNADGTRSDSWRCSECRTPFWPAGARASQPAEAQIAAAYAQDRADRYPTSSGCWVAVADLAEALEAGEHLEAFRHGELDDLLAQIRERARKRIGAQPKGGVSRLKREEP